MDFNQGFEFHFIDYLELAIGIEYFGTNMHWCTILGLYTCVWPKFKLPSCGLKVDTLPI